MLTYVYAYARVSLMFLFLVAILTLGNVQAAKAFGEVKG